MNGLRIAFVTPEYVTENYFSGGLANYVHRIAKSLVSQGHEVYVLTLSDSEQSEFVHYGVRVHRITVTPPSRWLKRITRYRLNRTLKYLDFSTRAFLRLRQLNKQEQLDIVQFPNYQACGLISRFFLRIPQVTRISSYSPIWNEQSKSKRNLDAKTLEWLEWLQLRLSRNIYAPSFTLKKILAQEAKISNVRVIRTPFYQEAVDWDESLYEPCLKEKQYLLFFGRFQLHKGFHILAQAVPYV
jgi:glycosyltransferase involved in cell wall biosynthesis